ncbi:hypothetical protein KHS38_10945 [Mucilaginibacter sp. Bleaf8]|uniref:four-carbon acid sugar kinase family protein n=1 Tax=Mucilaginibacter sp. Bleaf8 TaxID=2834430 RepID=UPI001BD0CE2F|nr:four-carbon acid sugar kinase family protein [Mucilaginibacter sp. Bleaf8]MBS7564923.1 hypothetical protein [Mucilaginibacter sp. Bleaf8]
MIAVIADDLTGAAEIGGIGLQYNLSVEICTQVNPATTADLLIINTDSRSRNEEEAVAVVTKACEDIKQLNPILIYKKVDSVLRGHVLAEVEAELKVLELAGTYILPANPALGRTLVSGTYWVHGVPVHETSFAADPEFPVTSANVLHMLKATRRACTFKKHHEVFTDKGMVIGEVASVDDLQHWAQKAARKKYMVGASGFFNALLNVLNVRNAQPVAASPPVGKPALYVSGTTFQKNAGLIKDLYNSGGPVSYMPSALLESSVNDNELITKWSSEISNLLQLTGKAVIAINQQLPQGGVAQAVHLRNLMAAVVKHVFDQVAVKELVIEGGSTAASILKSLALDTLLPVQELAAGVIRNAVLHPQNLYVTLKPGSYTWSEKIWNF